MGIKNNSNNNRRIKVKQYINITETLKRYERALKSISKSSDQAKAIHLKIVAQTALDSETTTADEFNAPHGSAMEKSDYDEFYNEFNVPVITGDKDTDALLEDERIAQDENLKSQQDMLDRHRDMESEIAEYDKKLSEIAESEWRGTVLSKNYKSPFDEEE